MAHIFYRPDGSIYGVHPDGNIAVPPGIQGFDMPGTPDQIPWPVPAGHATGRQQWTRVNLSTLALEVDPARVPPPDPDEALQQAIAAAATLQELKDALLGKTRPGRVPGVRP